MIMCVNKEYECRYEHVQVLIWEICFGLIIKHLAPLLLIVFLCKHASWMSDRTYTVTAVLSVSCFYEQKTLCVIIPLSQIGQRVKQRQEDKENGSVFRGLFWWLTSQSWPVFWYWCVNGILSVETQNAIARVDSQATGKVNLVV